MSIKYEAHLIMRNTPLRKVKNHRGVAPWIDRIVEHLASAPFALPPLFAPENDEWNLESFCIDDAEIREVGSIV